MTLIWGLQEKNPALENKFAAVTSRAVSSECVWPCFQRFPLKHIVREIAGSSKGRGGNLCSLSAGGGGALVAQQHRYTAHRCVFNSLRKLRIAFLILQQINSNYFRIGFKVLVLYEFCHFFWKKMSRELCFEPCLFCDFLRPNF